jgi:subtilisin-like proprotein convertase family protein
VKRGLLILKALSVIIFLSNAVYADTYTFTQTTPFVFQGTTNSSVIFASGMIGNVTDVNITLNGLKVNNPFQGISEIDVLLVGPQGQKIILVSYVCEAFTSPGPFDFTFAASASGALPAGNSGMSCVSGTYLPSDYHDQTVVGYVLGSPAPAPPYSINLADLNNVNPAGNWTLYAAEHEGNEGGTIDSWTLTIETDGVASICMYEENFIDNVLTYSEIKPNVEETGGSLVLTPTSKKAYSTSDASFVGIQNSTITTNLKFSSNSGLKEKGFMLTH